MKPTQRKPIQRSPRIQVTLAPEIMAILDELSEATGQAKATMVNELLTDALPGLKVAAEAIRKVKSAPREAQAELARYANEAAMRLAQEQLAFDDLLAEKPSRKRSRSKGATDGAP